MVPRDSVTYFGSSRWYIIYFWRKTWKEGGKGMAGSTERQGHNFPFGRCFPPVHVKDPKGMFFMLAGTAVMVSGQGTRYQLASRLHIQWPCGVAFPERCLNYSFSHGRVDLPNYHWFNGLTLVVIYCWISANIYHLTHKKLSYIWSNFDPPSSVFLAFRQASFYLFIYLYSYPN